jgi:hypothetical protein
MVDQGKAMTALSAEFRKLTETTQAETKALKRKFAEEISNLREESKQDKQARVSWDDDVLIRLVQLETGLQTHTTHTTLPTSRTGEDV